MPTLVVDARMIHASGIGVYLRNILPFLAEKYDTTLLGCPQELAKFKWPANTRILSAGAPIYSLKEQWQLFRKVPACDIFWSPHYNVPVLPLPARKRVVTIHDTYHLAYQHTLSHFKKAYARYFLRTAALRSNAVITVSQFSKAELMRYTGVSPAAVSVIYNGIQAATFNKSSTASAQENLQGRHPNLPKQPFLLFVGNVKPHKNLLTLLRAYAQVIKSQDIPHHLLIVGQQDGFITGDQAVGAYLREHPTLQERVHFTGYVDDQDLPLLYNAASLFVFPSLYEGFGLPPLEAMACGCPVIASNAASMPEVCGQAALYFDPLDVPVLAGLLLRVLREKDLREELQKLGFKQAMQYNWQVAAARHLDVFERVLQET
ncbi:glycosyltransferase family 4 protein [Pontibacter sp. CAU 1760]